jgi:hypothetical protein
MMKTKEEILTEIFEPVSQHCTTPRQDLQLAITLDPLLERIEQAMEKYSEQFSKQLESKLSKEIDWDKLRTEFFNECVDKHPLMKVNLAPHDMFEWFKSKISEQELRLSPNKEAEKRRLPSGEELRKIAVSKYPGELKDDQLRRNGFVEGYVYAVQCLLQ